MTQNTAVEWLVKKLSIYIKGVISIDKLDGIRDAVLQANELHKADVMRSYRAGMMQGIRMLQSYMTFEQQARFGFHDKEDGKINALLDKEAEAYYIQTYLNKTHGTTDIR